MAYYNNQKEYLDGRLILYQRNVATKSASNSNKPAVWYMLIKFDGLKGRAIKKSTKQTILEEAYIIAMAEYNRIDTAVRLGKGYETWTFEKHWNDWHKRKTQDGSWREERRYWHEKYYNRYFKEYFLDKHTKKSMKLDDIDIDYAQRYFEWRITYWQRNADKIKYNPKRRGLKTQSTNNYSKNPAKKTLQMEQSALNQIFFDAVERNRTLQRFRVKAPDVDNGNGQRAGFTKDEYTALYRYLRSYRNATGVFKAPKMHKTHKLLREQMYCFIIFMANSGLRVGEARMMKWSDVKRDIALEDERLIAEVRVSQHTKKRKVRYVQVQEGGNKQLNDWYNKSPNIKADDWVWFTIGKGSEITQFGNLNVTFQNILKTIPYNDREQGLLYDADGKRRSLYSLRHIYADLRLDDGVPIEDLAKNMGTMVKQIEQHYSHRQTRDSRDVITQRKVKTKKVGAADDFVGEALKLYKAGKLSEKALREIVSNN
ncbi:site-specific integrase [Amylibacter sp.]|nr:site-specific integrase [Amylibacter sp.]